MSFKPIVFESLEQAKTAFFNGRCQVYTTDRSGLAAIISSDAPNPDDYLILPDTISKEPLGPVVRRGDDAWFTIVKWLVYALIEAEEKGVTQGNVASMMGSQNPVVQRLLASRATWARSSALIMHGRCRRSRPLATTARYIAATWGRSAWRARAPIVCGRMAA